MKRKTLMILISFAVLAIFLGIILLLIMNNLRNRKFEVIDATYNKNECKDELYEFYKDDKYTYYLVCSKSDSVFVKFASGKKVLATQALKEKLVTIDELTKAGLKITK